MTRPPDSIAALSAFHQWVLWKPERYRGRVTKTPYQTGNPELRASVFNFHNPSYAESTWGDYRTAARQLETGKAAGAGFVFTAYDPYCGIDLDDCVDEQGRVHAAQDLVSRLNGYTEVSPSGRGLHILVEGKLRGKRRKTSKTPWGGAFEVYDRRRFFTVNGTGHGPLADRQAQLDEVVGLWLPERALTPTQAEPRTPNSMPDAEMLDRAFRAKNGAKVRKLWEGDTSDYPSHSHADIALCRLLAFWTGPDPERICRLFRQSGLMRDKWDRDDYREGVVGQVLSTQLAGRVTESTVLCVGERARARG